MARSNDNGYGLGGCFVPTVAIILTIIILFFTTSCSRNGYGCKGNSKIMTRVR